MKKMFQAILFQGIEFSYNLNAKEISLASMFGYVVEEDGKVQIANRIFETCLYNYFYAEEELSNGIIREAKQDKNYFIHDGRLDMDIVMQRFVTTFVGEQFIIELKIWHGNEYNERGEKQLASYLDYYHQDKVYLLSFNFNQKKEVGVKEIMIDGKRIVEAVV